MHKGSFVFILEINTLKVIEDRKLIKSLLLQNVKIRMKTVYINTPFLDLMASGKSVSPSISLKSISIVLHKESIGMSFAIP
jgi:hypothetical protein